MLLIQLKLKLKQEGNKNMTNEELDSKVRLICARTNMFDALIEAKELEQDYKNSDFYKATKMPFDKMLEKAKLWYSIDYVEITNKLQQIIDGLSLEKITDIIGQLGDVFAKENEEITKAAETYKNIVS